jgi:hypothetical protein
MTSTVISDTITSVVVEELGESVASQYAPAIEKISAALTEQAYTSTDRLIEFAVQETGYDEDTLRGFIENSGLPVRPKPEPVVEDEPIEYPVVDPASDSGRIHLLEEGQAKINEALGSLIGLAQKVSKHLGLDD